MLAVAEDVAADGVLRQALAAPVTTVRNPVSAVAESARQVSGTSAVVVTDPALRIVTATDLSLVGAVLPTADRDGGEPSLVARGRSWTGLTRLGGASGPGAVAAHVPVLSDDGRLLGAVAVTRDLPGVWTRLTDSAPDLLTYLGLASLLGVVGSSLLAGRVKRQTLGMEPREIAGLVEQREAMLLGIREGVLGVDRDGRVVLVNDAARRLLGLPAPATPPDGGAALTGRTLVELGVDDHLRAALVGPGPDPEDLVITREEAVVVINRRPIVTGGVIRGWVTTLRDRTELVALQRELGTTRGTTETLRAQAHEFSNRLHTISGLIEIGEYDEVVRYVGTLEGGADDDATVTGRIGDPAVAALLVAKVGLAHERAAHLEVGGVLGRVPPDLSADLVTVVGNLVDNGLDAVSGRADAQVRVELADTAAAVTVTVADTGPGVRADPPESVFGRGVSTKSGDGRGIGLSLVRVVCVRRGGDVTVRDGERGAVFTARLPLSAPPRVDVTDEPEGAARGGR